MSASASAPLLTGKNRRRTFQALIAAPLLALGIAAGSGTAHASSLTFIPGEVHLSNGYCSVSGWPGGTIYCGTSVGANFPNGTQEIFGTGLNDAVWTDWGTEAHPSGWKSLGAPPHECDPNPGNESGRLLLSNDTNYGLSLYCTEFNGFTAADYRSDGPNGSWSGWED
jgi:hypothetical protein